MAQTAPPSAAPPENQVGEAARPAQKAAETQPKDNKTSPSYLLQSGDDLEVRVYDLPELSAVVAIRPDGKVSLPLQSDLQAAGLTAAQLTDVITAGYQKEFRNPRVTVIVRSFSSENVYIGGEVAHAGFVPLKGEMTVFQAVFRAGGFKETAKADSVILVRNDGRGKPLVSKLNLDDVLKGKPDTKLQAFDLVFVPKTRIAQADRFIDQYIRQLLPISSSFGFNYLLGQFVP